MSLELGHPRISLDGSSVLARSFSLASAAFENRLQPSVRCHVPFKGGHVRVLSNAAPAITVTMALLSIPAVFAVIVEITVLIQRACKKKGYVKLVYRSLLYCRAGVKRDHTVSHMPSRRNRKWSSSTSCNRHDQGPRYRVQ